MLMFTFFLVMSGVLGDDDYCSLGYRKLCEGKGLHVACQFPVAGAGPFCHNHTRVELTTKIQNFITDDINRRRERLAAGEVVVWDGRIPPPRAMMLVSWDRELANLAQRLADQCQFVHDECRATVRYPYAGQCVGEVRLRRPRVDVRHISRVVAAWWSERENVRVGQLMAPFAPDKSITWGHFSQLSIWNLRSVGCGVVIHGATTLLVVCDFSHTNMLGQATLQAGPAGDCPDGSERRGFSMLCAPILSNKNHRGGNKNIPDDSPLEHFRTKDVEETRVVYEGLKITSARPKWRTRKKWNQRVRLNRPVVSILLKNRPIVISSGQPLVALNLDKEDLEQLYRDTGFRVQYEKRPTSLNK